jgi:tetratricopeptide (TPR) repeat protein
MVKNYCRLLAFSSLLIVCSLQLTSAQDKASREAQWQSYQVPSAPFKRYVSPNNSFILRVPLSWQQMGSDLHFRGESEIEFRLIVEKIPDGLGLKSYMAAVLQNLRNLPGGVDALSVRRTQISGLDARELSFTVEDVKGVSSRRFLWVLANGAEALTFLFFTPDARQAENLPYFKGIVQSAIIPDRRFSYEEFDYLRGKIVSQNLSARVDEVQSLVGSLEGRDASEREKAVAGLAKIFATTPVDALDLLLDRRPFVRAFVVRAMALSGNIKLRDFLIHGVGDPDSFVATQAAQTVASMPDIVALIRNTEQGFLFHDNKLLRVGALLDVQTRAEVAAELFKTKSSVVAAAMNFQVQTKRPPRKDVPPPPPPPPPVAKAGPKAKTAPRSLGVMNVGGSKSSLRTGKPTANLNLQLMALNLISAVPANLIKMPFAEITAQNNERLNNIALEVAYSRRELLPVEPLFKLLDSPENRFFAIWNLAQSASLSDVAKIESHIQKLSAKKPDTKKTGGKPTEGFVSKPDSAKSLTLVSDAVFIEQLRIALKKIHLREALAKADKEGRTALLKKALDDKQLTSWVWEEYWRDETEGVYTYTQSPTRVAKMVMHNGSAAQVMPFGENLFPENVTLYAALPKPGEALGRLGDSLSNMQMDTAREQAQFLVMFNSLRELLMSSLGAKTDEFFLEAAGIKADAPMALASWTSENAPRGMSMAQRSAVVVRVNDRDRFERALTVYQNTLGNFKHFPAYVSGVSRFIGLAPALLPYVASAIIDEAPEAPKPMSTSYSLTGFEECKGYAVKVIERRTLEEDGTAEYDRIYLAYVQDTALLAPDWFSMREVLTRLESKSPNLSANPGFKRALENDGEVIYMSDAGAALDMLVGRQSSPTAERVTESGALKISNNAWQSVYQLLFKNNDWAKPLQPFQTGEMAAPRELLPKSTLVYLLTKLDATLAWREWGKDFFSADELASFQSGWAVDFEKEVLPELAGEAGASLLNFPQGDDGRWRWAVFFKLKGDRLGKAFNEGKVFKQASQHFARLKLGDDELVAAIKNDYLIFTDSEASLERFEAKEKLQNARDFAKAVSQAPANVVAFGGYNLESAMADLEISGKDPNTRDAISRFVAIARAFHSQHFYASMDARTLNARLSVSLAREGRYSVAELSQMAKDFELAYAVVEARGLPIVDQSRIDSLKLRIKAKSQGVVERIKANIDSDAQKVEKQGEDALLLTLRPRRVEPQHKTRIPLSGAAFAEHLKPTRQIRSDDAGVIAKAREIVGEEKDAWAVARKLSQWIYKNLQWKKVDDADAAQTLASRQADCLEFSELFIAMARSLGLPARLVTGLAHSGSSFGGHAWVEVYAGEWIELDPTWGTDYVDATHIRGESAELLSYAVLNLIEMEALEIARATPDFQRDPSRLVEAISRDFASAGTGKDEALSVALDMKMLADNVMGAGAWDAMNEKEREQFSASQRTLIFSLSKMFEPAEGLRETIRLLKTNVDGNRAEVLALQKGELGLDENLLKFRLARKGDAWMLLELVLMDEGFNIIAESLHPAVQTMAEQRKGRPRQGNSYSAMTRAMSVWSSDVKLAFEIIEQGLKESPDDRALHLFKVKLILHNAILLNANVGADPKEIEAKKAEVRKKREEARIILETLSDEKRAFLPALMSLADFYGDEEGGENKMKAIALYERYAALMPEDPRPLQKLASLHHGNDEVEKALADYRGAIERDGRNASNYADLAALLVTLKRFDEAMKCIDEGAKYADADADLFADLFWNLEDDVEIAEALAVSQSQRMAKNANANIRLAYRLIWAERAKDGLPLLKKALEIDPKNAEARVALSDAHKQLKNWAAVLTATDEALKLDAKLAEAYYNRACALARLSRKTEAIQALQKAIELDEELLYDIGEDEDLKLLAAMPAFKKLLKQMEDANKAGGNDETIKR